jgi:hypothetical protein
MMLSHDIISSTLFSFEVNNHFPKDSDGMGLLNNMYISITPRRDLAMAIFVQFACMFTSTLGYGQGIK